MTNNQIKNHKIIEFQGTKLEIIGRNGTSWLRGDQIDTALGYSKNQRAGVRILYNRHEDEFTPEMTTVIELLTIGGMQKIRIFSPRGCHLLGMLARTAKAKAFRRWVLDVLEDHIKGNQRKYRDNQLTELQKTLLDRAPSWQKILHYLNLGLNTFEIARLLYSAPVNILESLCRMENCGLLPPGTFVKHGYTSDLKDISIVAQKRTDYGQFLHVGKDGKPLTSIEIREIS